MPMDIYTGAGDMDEEDTHFLAHQRERAFSWDPGVTSAADSAPLAVPSFRKARRKKDRMALSNLSSSEEEYTSSDNDHLYMAPSPRRTNSNGGPVHVRPTLRSRTASRSTPLCICRNPASVSVAATAAQAYSPVEPGIWNELRRLFPGRDPHEHFNVLTSGPPVLDDRGVAFTMVQASVQTKDGGMIAKSEPCTDQTLALRSLRNALIEAKGTKSLPLANGEEIIAERIPAFAQTCSACGQPRY